MSLINEPSVDFHLKLNEQSFHIPNELLKRNAKLVNKLIERETKRVSSLFEDVNTLMAGHDDHSAMTKLGEIIKTVELLERKLEKRITVESELLQRIEYRINYFKELDSLKGNEDKDGLVEWYRRYTNILVGDYLTRNSEIYENELTELDRSAHMRQKRKISSGGSTPPLNAGIQFLRSQGLEHHLDYDILVTANRISKNLTSNHDLSLLVNWIKENQAYLVSKSSPLEFETRLQEYIELVKDQNYPSAISCFQTHLVKFIKTNFEELKLASGLLVFIKSYQQQMHTPVDVEEKDVSNLSSRSGFFRYFFNRPSLKPPRELKQPTTSEVRIKSASHANFERYTQVLSDERWDVLKDLFLQEYYSMYGISQHEPLLIYLSLGISTLKTRACMHEMETHGGSNDSLTNYLRGEITKTNCPVCSKEFSAISGNLPYAHHIQSSLFDDPVMLPNGNIYDSKKLKQLAVELRSKMLCELQSDQILDPIDQKVFSEKDFITMYPT